jgi:hypothetical protein
MTQAPLVQRAGTRGNGTSGPGRTSTPPSGGRYGLLLLLLILTYLLSASGLVLVTDIQTVLFLGVVLLALRTARISRRLTRLLVAVALIGSAAATVALLTHTPGGMGAADIWKGLMLLLTAGIIVRRILARPTVTIQSIYGALSAYLILGLMFAAFYAAFQHLGSEPFFASHEPASTQTFQYFSFTTLTTLGYGDFTAATNGGRALAVMEALTGQVFLATLVARLVAAFRTPTGSAGAASQAPPAGPTLPAARRRWPPSSVRRRNPAVYHRKPPGGASRTGSRPPRP